MDRHHSANPLMTASKASSAIAFAGSALRQQGTNPLQYPRPAVSLYTISSSSFPILESQVSMTKGAIQRICHDVFLDHVRRVRGEPDLHERRKTWLRQDYQIPTSLPYADHETATSTESEVQPEPHTNFGHPKAIKDLHPIASFHPSIFHFHKCSPGIPHPAVTICIEDFPTWTYPFDVESGDSTLRLLPSLH